MNPNITMYEVILRILAVVVIIFLVLPFHEYAHGWVAGKLGDPTPRYSGRMSLNPIVHMDPIGSIGILIFGFGWAKPVPIDPRYFKNPKRDMAITALAGPISNILAAIIGGFLINIIGLFKHSLPYFLFNAINTFFLYYIVINISLAIFNMLPIPPLDGSKVIAAFIPNRIIYKYMKYQNIIVIMLFLLLLIGLFDRPLSIMQFYLYNGIIWFTSLPFSFFS